MTENKNTQKTNTEHNHDKEWCCLHCHSEYSILDGFAKIKDYVDVAKSRGAKGFGLTDHGTCSGLFEMIQECNSAGIKPVPGFEAYVAPENPEGAFCKKQIFYGPNGQKAKYDVSAGAYLHLTLFAYNEKGFNNLLKLTSLAWEKERFYSKPRIDTDLLFKYSEGLIVTTGCPSSEISTRFLLGQDDKAYEYASRLKSVFGEHMYVELMDHNMEGEELERILVPKLVKLAEDLDLPLLATNDCHYVFKDDAEAHENMLCLQTGAFMSEPTYREGGRRFAFSGPEYYMKTDAEMREIFPDDKFPGAVDNTIKLVDNVEKIELNYDPTLRPEIEIPEGDTEVTYLKKLIQKGWIEKRKNASKEVQEESKKRIREEFEVIHSNDFVNYFLVVHDYIDWAHKNNIPTGAGRGCFLPETPVMLSDGSQKPIQEIKPNDVVKVFGNDSSSVLEKFQYEVENEEIISIELENGKIITSTSDHMYLTANNGYIQAKDITPDAVLIGVDNNELFSDEIELTQPSIVNYPYTTTMYPQDIPTEITFISRGIHRACSFAEASGSPYQLVQMSINLNDESLLLPALILDSPEGSYGLVVVPDSHLEKDEIMKLQTEHLDVLLISDLATEVLLYSSVENEQKFYAKVVSVKKDTYTGSVFDLKVDTFYNYVVENVVVHNSVGGSEIAYVLDISDTDPIKYDLLFERFLSPGRGSLYKIEYEDGTEEEISVSEKRKVLTKDNNVVEKYIHELTENDVLVLEEGKQ